METLKVEKSTAKKLFPDSPGWFQEILINTFGEKFFSRNITDRIKTFRDACNELGVDPEDIFQPPDTLDEIAYKKLKVIARALRGDWEPNWNDGNEKKWYPYFRWSSGSGFGFSHSSYTYDCSATYVGSRLCFPTSELAEYFGKQFIEIHRELLTINK
jgi:hypothetical protein